MGVRRIKDEYGVDYTKYDCDVCSVKDVFFTHVVVIGSRVLCEDCDRMGRFHSAVQAHDKRRQAQSKEEMGG